MKKRVENVFEMGDDFTMSNRETYDAINFCQVQREREAKPREKDGIKACGQRCVYGEGGGEEESVECGKARIITLPVCV